MTLQQYIKKKPYLVWYTNNLDNLSDESIFEAIINYGDFDDFKKVIQILGIPKMAKIFKKKTRQKRSNFNTKMENYLKLFFKQYA